MTDIPQIIEMISVNQIDCPNVKPITIEQLALIIIEIIVKLALPILSEISPPTTHPIPPAIPIEINDDNAMNQCGVSEE